MAQAQFLFFKTIQSKQPNFRRIHQEDIFLNANISTQSAEEFRLLLIVLCAQSVTVQPPCSQDS